MAKCDIGASMAALEVAPANPAQVMDAMVAEAAKSLGHEGVYISYETIRRALTAAIGAGDEQPFHLVEEFDDVGAQMVVAPAMGVGGQAVAEDWRDDPSADERWNAGLDYGQTQLCAVLGVDPEAIDWDAATETLDGDVQAVIGKILTARFGEEWPSAFSQPHPADERTCTCHPDDNPPKLCSEKYALSECRKAADERVVEALRRMLRLFDDQGNLIADFAQMQGAIGNGYQALSAKEGRS